MPEGETEMKIWIESDEWYPVFDFYKEDLAGFGVECEIEESEYQELLRVFNDFKRVQDRLRQLAGYDNE